MTDPMQARRFEDDPGWGEASGRAEVPLAGVARGRLPNRVQRELRARDRESLLPAGHRARRVWAWVERADLGALYASIRAVAGGSGRTAMAPEILFGRWLYATLEGVGSARALARLTQEHDAYRWICGGASVTDHTLAAFRRAQGAAFDALLPESVAVLLAAGVVSLKRVAQEGLRVRASAGAAAFRRGATLEACLEQAREQVERLKRQDEDDPGAASRRQQAARERQARLERALQRRPERAEIKAKPGQPRAPARVATTDAEATVIKLADGGDRPADNGPFASDTAAQFVVGVAAACVGTDRAPRTPRVEQVETRYGQSTPAWLVDGGYPAHAPIDQAAAHTTVYAPVPKAKDPDTDPHARKEGDRAAVGAGRERLRTEAAKAIYPERAATAEGVNAQARERGLTRLRVRVTAQVRGVLLLHALAHHLMRTLAVAPHRLGYGRGASAETAMAT